jgi:hypothetical protein
MLNHPQQLRLAPMQAGEQPIQRDVTGLPPEDTAEPCP